MEELLVNKIGQQVEVTCGAASFEGEILEVKNGVLHLDGEKDVNFIAVQQITLFKELSEDRQRVGF